MADDHILLIDAHAAVRDGLALLLHRAGWTVVGATGDPARAVQLTGSRRPRVIMLDLDRGPEDAAVWLARLHAASPESRVLVYTAAEKPGILEAALAADVDGVLLKACSSAELLEAVRCVAEGRRYVDVRLDEILRDALGDDLSPREKQILERLAAGLTGEQVAAELYVSPETVRTHVRNAMRKLGAQTRARAIVLALQSGRIALPEEIA